MPIDSSIYQASTPIPVNMPNPMESAQKAMALNQMGMQQMQMARQLRTQSDIQDAYMQNTDPQTGQLNQEGYLAHLGRINPMAAQQESSRIAGLNKEQAEAKGAQVDAAQKALNITGPALEDFAYNTPDSQKPEVWPKMIQRLKDQNIDVSNINHPYDPDLLKQYMGIWSKNKTHLENVLTQANTEKSLAETDKARAEAGNVEKTRATDYQKLLLNDERYKESTGVIAQGNSALAAIEDAEKNPQSRTEIPIILARFSTGGKRMSNVEVEKGAAAGDFGDKIKQMYFDSKKGVLDPDMADYARQYVTSQMKPAAQNKAAVENDIAGKYAMDAGLRHSDAYARLTSQAPGTVAQTPDGPARFSKASGNGGGSGLVPNANAAPPPPPKPGDVRRGHVFNGGDPSDRRNWKKVSNGQ